MTDVTSVDNGNADQCSTSTEPITTFFKRWLITKLHGDQESQIVDNSTGAGKQDPACNNLPTIVISKGSPAVRRPSPLAKSWLEFDDAGGKSPQMKRLMRNSLKATPTRTRSYKSECSAYTFPGVKSPVTNLKYSESMPSTPIASKEPVKINKKRPTSYEPGRPPSSVTKHAQRYSMRSNHNPLTPSSCNCSKSDTDSPSLCSKCSSGAQATGSREFLGFEFPNLVVRKSHASSGPHFLGQSFDESDENNLPLRRTSSCQIPSVRESHVLKKQIVKARSNIDVQKRYSNKKRNNKKDKNQSSIALSRTWSVNFEPFKIIRHSSSRSIPRKMSLNETAISRVSCRRRSSLLRMCVQTSASLDRDETRTADSGDDLDEAVPSPQVTRRANYSSCDPLNVFKSTFESDSISIPSIYGQIKVMFQFLNEREELQVTLLKGNHGLVGANIGATQEGRLGIYATVCLMPGKRLKKSTEGRHNTRDPVFYDLFCFKMTLSEVMERHIRVKFYNRPGIFCKSVPVGECFIKMYDYDMTASNVIWQNIRRCYGQRDTYDEFDFGSFEREVQQPRPPSLLCGLLANRMPSKR